MKSFIIGAIYGIIGKLIMFPVIMYTLHKNKSTLPDWAFYFDNQEDGFTGNKRLLWSGKGWYDNYLGITAKEHSLLYQTWRAYVWSTRRNSAWNIRFHPSASMDVSSSTIELKGNTRSHDYTEGYQRYNIVIDGKYKSFFRLIPITSKISVYLRWGWKIYPEYYIGGATVPEFKDRSIWTISVRLKSAE